MSLTFKGINSGGFGGYELTDHLTTNIKLWLDWGLLHHGAFSRVNYDSYSTFNDAEARLLPVIDQRYEEGRVWNGFGNEWVWEEGVSISGSPFRVSGIYINNNFYDIDSQSPYSYHVDYNHGRVIFDIPMDPEADIRAEYCYRSVFVSSTDHPDYSQLLQNSIVDFASRIEPSGIPDRDRQVWLPAIFIDVNRGTQRGLALGGGQIKSRTVILHVFADNRSDRNLLMDWLDYQSRSAFIMADLNSMSYPLDEWGSPVSGVTNWVDMTNSHPCKKLRIMNGKVQRIDSLNPNIFRGRVTWDVEIDYPGI